ncbi:MAG TPA: hypothetical protein VG815_05200 [Chloroflexota bacterium]|nr:hypothetical protein [Chloroflexota bacterium]
MCADHDVDDRLSRKTRHGGAANVLDGNKSNAKIRGQALLLEAKRPNQFMLVGLEMNGFVKHLNLSG